MRADATTPPARPETKYLLIFKNKKAEIIITEDSVCQRAGRGDAAAPRIRDRGGLRTCTRDDSTGS